VRTLDISTKGLEEVTQYFERLPEVAERASLLAINDTARFARREGSKQIRSQVNFKRDYLGSETSGRFVIGQFATAKRQEAVIVGRDRPTSLARFATGAVRFGRPRSPIKVKVSAGGSATQLKRAFFVRLRAGKALNEDNFNVGLAVRVNKGEKITNKRISAAPFGKNAFLLYGPSVGQVFSSVADELVGPVADRLEQDFVRQFERLSRG
jgi:hypothetical protein